MTTPDRLHRNRCIGLRVAILLAVVFAALSWGEWAPLAVFLVGGLLALFVYRRDCRSSDAKSAQTNTHTRDS
jgi:membrane protein implicated in regulation of membrane protease activity